MEIRSGARQRAEKRTALRRLRHVSPPAAARFKAAVVLRGMATSTALPALRVLAGKVHQQPGCSSPRNAPAWAISITLPCTEPGCDFLHRTTPAGLRPGLRRSKQGQLALLTSTSRPLGEDIAHHRLTAATKFILPRPQGFKPGPGKWAFRVFSSKHFAGLGQRCPGWWQTLALSPSRRAAICSSACSGPPRRRSRRLLARCHSRCDLLIVGGQFVPGEPGAESRAGQGGAVNTRQTSPPHRLAQLHPYVR